jgi:hypothetical protein
LTSGRSGRCARPWRRPRPIGVGLRHADDPSPRAQPEHGPVLRRQPPDRSVGRLERGSGMGRIGRPGRVRVDLHSGSMPAQAAAERVVRRKRGGGYW